MDKNYHQIKRLSVFQDEVLAGTLLRTSAGSRFEYTPEFLASGARAIAKNLPLDPIGFECRGMANLHPYFAGLVPEGFMLDILLKSIRTAKDDLFSILAATGEDAIGDVTLVPEGQVPSHRIISLNEVDWKALLDHRPPPRIAAIAGAQPKVSVGSLIKSFRTRTSRQAYIAKIAPSDLPGLVENEHLFMRAARRSGIVAAKTEIVNGCLLVSRFDRRYDPTQKRLKQIHVEDMLQSMDEYPNAKYSFEYLDLAQSAWRLTQSSSVILKMLELYAFSYLIGNGDLHARNVSLILDEHGLKWDRSPAYDLLSTLPYVNVIAGADRMILALSDERFGRFEPEHFIEFGARFDIPSAAVNAMLKRLVTRAEAWLPELTTLPFPPPILDSMSWTIQSRMADLDP